MVFEKPTQLDLDNSVLYCLEREKILSFNHFLKILPHIFSHVNVEIRHNKSLNNKQENLVDSNIYVRLIGSKEFCKQVRCNASYPRGMTCKPDTDPLTYKSGDGDVYACQAPCFQLYPESTLDLRAPLTRYSERQNCCLLHNNQPFSAATDDYMRTDVHPTSRIDTIGTGFDVDRNNSSYFDFAGNETFKYELNRYYCDDFLLNFENGECKPSIGQRVNDLFLSSNLYKAIQYGIRYAETGVGLHDVQIPNLPPKGPPPENKEAWLLNINKSAYFFDPMLKLSDLGITSDRLHLFFTTEYGWPGRLVEPLILPREPSAYKNVKIVDFVTGNEKLLPQFQVDSNGRRYLDEYKIIGVQEIITDLYANSEKDRAGRIFGGLGNAPNEINLFLTSIPSLIGNEEFWLTIGSGFSSQVVDVLKDNIESQLIKMQRKTITESMTTIVKRSILSTIANRTGYVARKFTFNTLRLFTSTLRALSVVGIIADLIGIVDLFLINADLFDLRNLKGKQFANTFSEMDLAQNEKQYGYKTVEYSPAYFMAMYDLATSHSKEKQESSNIIFQEELHTEVNLDFIKENNHLPKWSINSSKVGHKNDVKFKILWQTEYLYRLERNSNNLKINWFEERGAGTIHEFNAFVDTVYDIQAIVNFKMYIKNAFNRVDLLKYGTIITIILLIASVFIPTLIPLFISLLMSISMFALTFSKI